METEDLTLEERYKVDRVGGAFNARNIQKPLKPVVLQTELEVLYDDRTTHAGGDFNAKAIDTTKTR